MKNLLTRLFFIGGIIVYLILLSNRSGAIPGVTGAPGEVSCATTGCHETMPNQGDAAIKLEFEEEGNTTYSPGTTHTLKISIDMPQNATRNGFEMVALDDQNANVGEWILTGNDKRMRSDNNRDYVTQTIEGSAQSSWEIDWKSPATDVGTITFYLAYNDADDNGGKTGDDIYTTSFSVSPFSTAVKDIIGLESLAVYPNPFKERLNLKLNLTQEINLRGRLVNQAGQLMKNLFHEKIPAGISNKSFLIPNDLAPGMYFLELSNPTKDIKSIRVIKA